MKELLVLLRALQIYTHDAHHHCARVPFFQDHEWFGSSYEAYEGEYDDVAERIIGLYGDGATSSKEILPAAMQKISSCPVIGVKENKVFFSKQLQLEMELNSLLNSIGKKAETTLGTQDLLSGIANNSETRIYKIKQRLK